MSLNATFSRQVSLNATFSQVVAASDLPVMDDEPGRTCDPYVVPTLPTPPPSYCSPYRLPYSSLNVRPPPLPRTLRFAAPACRGT